jgi:hypothetical protein
MKRSFTVAVAAMLLAACAGTDADIPSSQPAEPEPYSAATDPETEPEVEPESEPTPKTESELAPEPQRVDKAAERCAAATDEAVAFIDTVMDRIEADPDGVYDSGGVDLIADMFGEIGHLMTTECNHKHLGEGLSVVLASIAKQEASRGPAASAFAGGLGGICEFALTDLAERGVELSTQGRAACAGR